MVASKEFYVTPDGLTHVLIEGKDNLLRNQPEMIDALYHYLESTFTYALDACMKEAAAVDPINVSRHKFLAVDRFIRCNFSLHDLTPDIFDGHLEMEDVPCHLRGMCRYEKVICKPRCTLLKTDDEERCVAHLCLSRGYKATAKKLCIGESAVRHVWARIKKRLNIKDNLELASFFRGMHIERRLSIK